MSRHVAISPNEAADRLAIRELVEAYAHYADRRDAKGQMALFTKDTHFVVYMNAKDPTPSADNPAAPGFSVSSPYLFCGEVPSDRPAPGGRPPEMAASNLDTQPEAC
jgi:SnoaL-like domain